MMRLTDGLLLLCGIERKKLHVFLFDPMLKQIIGKYNFAETDQDTIVSAFKMSPCNEFIMIYTQDCKLYIVFSGNQDIKKLKTLYGCSYMRPNDAFVSQDIYFGTPKGQIFMMDASSGESKQVCKIAGNICFFARDQSTDLLFVATTMK